jgi:hypothetical protein
MHLANVRGVVGAWRSESTYLRRHRERQRIRLDIPETHPDYHQRAKIAGCHPKISIRCHLVISLRMVAIIPMTGCKPDVEFGHSSTASMSLQQKAGQSVGAKTESG